MSDAKIPKGFAEVPRFPGYVADRRGRLRRLDKRGRWVNVPPSKRSGKYTSTLMPLRGEEGQTGLSPATLVTLTFGFEDLLCEKWRVIPGWPLYEVSSCGRVRRQRRWGPRLLKGYQAGQSGSPTVVLHDGERLLHKTVHVLVLEVFGPPPQPGEDGHQRRRR